MKMMRGLMGLFVLGAFSGCVSGEPPDEGPFCGGIAGIPCPGAGVCLDDPSDDCDPDAGGADCGGICHCHALGLCTEGTHWDDSPDVCACVPDENPCAAVLCPVDTECIVEDEKPICVPLSKACGDVTCGPGLVCCNASCGICTPPGGVCIQIACE
jgi:hypothetical protein